MCHMPGPGRSLVTTTSSMAGCAGKAAAGNVRQNNSKREIRMGRLRSGLRHQCERPPFQVVETRQPLLRSIIVLVNHVGSLQEFHAARLQ